MSEHLPPGFEQLAGFRSDTSVLDGDGAAAAPTEAELAQPIVSPGDDALLPFGVEYQAPWDMPADGLARHARAQVRALAAAGLPVVLRRLNRPKMLIDDDADSLKNPSLTQAEREAVLAQMAVNREVGYLRDTSVGSVPIAIRQLVVHNSTFLENTVVPAGARMSGFADELRVYRSTIVYLPWERTTVSPAIVEVLNRCAEVWVHGQWCVNIFKRAGVKQVYAIPMPYDPSTNLACRISAPRGSETVPEGKRFYAIGKWEPRKNYDALIGAFLLEFSPKEHASLFLKTHEWGSWEHYPSVSASISKWLGDPAVQAKGWTGENYSKRLRVVAKKIPEEKIAQLHRDNNIYVSCSHAEAWDIPAFDARCAGNRMVYTGWGGPVDFAGGGDVRIWTDRLCDVDAGALVPVHPGYGWEPDATWATSPVGWIRAAMRAAEPPKRRIHPPEFYLRFGLGPVGAMMAKRIEERFPEAYTKLVRTGGFG